MYVGRLGLGRFSKAKVAVQWQELKQKSSMLLRSLAISLFLEVVINCFELTDEKDRLY